MCHYKQKKQKCALCFENFDFENHKGWWYILKTINTTTKVVMNDSEQEL